jgi:hypothetical protein
MRKYRGKEVKMDKSTIIQQLSMQLGKAEVGFIEVDESPIDFYDPRLIEADPQDAEIDTRRADYQKLEFRNRN